jgi:hypothetical protein
MRNLANGVVAIREQARLAEQIAPEIGEIDQGNKMEATPGIEPGCALLQSAASPLRHVAP